MRYHQLQSDITESTFDVTINVTSANAEGLRGDLQIQHLWQLHNDTIIYVRVMDIDAKLYFSFPINKVLRLQENYNNIKYL